MPDTLRCQAPTRLRDLRLFDRPVEPPAAPSLREERGELVICCLGAGELDDDSPGVERHVVAAELRSPRAQPPPLFGGEREPDHFANQRCRACHSRVSSLAVVDGRVHMWDSFPRGCDDLLDRSPVIIECPYCRARVECPTRSGGAAHADREQSGAKSSNLSHVIWGPKRSSRAASRWWS